MQEDAFITAITMITAVVHPNQVRLYLPVIASHVLRG